MNISALMHLRWRTIILGAIGAVLIVLVVVHSFGAFLADAAPRAALWVDPDQPEALVNLADLALNTVTLSDSGSTALQSRQSAESANGGQDAKDNPKGDKKNIDRAFSAFEAIGRNESVSRPLAPSDASIIRMRANSALMHDPLNASALRVFGQLAEADGDDAEASTFMRVASRISLHESRAAYWLMLRSAHAGDYKAAIYYADILLRSDPQSYLYVVPVLAPITEDKAGASLIKTALADNPPWRENFISSLPKYVKDARTPLDLLLSLRADPVPPTTKEIAPYLNALIAHQYYALAYYTWLQFLPTSDLRHAGLLFNGDFQRPLSGLPFDWQIVPGAGVIVDIVPSAAKSGEQALLVDFQYGRVDYRSVSELVMLAPGTYQFDGQYKGSLVGPRGMKWRIVCVSGTMSGESPMITGTETDWHNSDLQKAVWKNFAFTFEIPAANCPAQYVRLDLDARSISERLVSGSIMFSNLQISRVTNPSNEASPSPASTNPSVGASPSAAVTNPSGGTSPSAAVTSPATGASPSTTVTGPPIGLSPATKGGQI